jgi:TonB-dependent SusC/RagA subfamily outer membrane receptor
MKKIIPYIILLMALGMDVHAQQTQDISSGAARTIYDLLRTVPGVEVATGSSMKDQPKVYIRDARNMKGKIAALFVLDNVIYEGEIASINPIDVANVTVLKDAASAAAYGSRGFGGVILITTKNGKGYLPPVVSNYEKSAYQYFISKGIELRVIGKDSKTITTGVISRESDSSIFIRKKEIHKKLIEKVEMIIE